MNCVIDWSAVGTVVTAFATIALAFITTILARETRRLSEAANQPYVVVTLEPSPWSIIHTNLVFQNTGTGAAYDIEVVFDPPLTLRGSEEDVEMPIRHLSVLKPGSSFNVFLRGYKNLNKQIVSVEVSWRHSRSSKDRECNSYVLNLLADYENWGQLGGPPPQIQVAKELTAIRKDIGSLVSGFKHLRVDTYNASDRAAYELALWESWEADASTLQEDQPKTEDASPNPKPKRQRKVREKKEPPAT